ncbi:MAG: hypothetical protein JSV80_17135 [Acidobacteriota bacterium]|nr:MAG: hypothetical protein JSV80_17135 [Acidobacteriota bacterium]
MAQNVDSGRHVPPYVFALVHSGLEQPDRALDRLKQAYAERDTMLRDLEAVAHWDRMRSGPRFEGLMRRTAHPESVS